MGTAEIEMFLTDLAVKGNAAASTQNQAFNALIFLYRQVLGIELSRINALRARRPKRLPTVLGPDEVRQLLDRVRGGVFHLMAGLLYGAGLRRLECCRSAVQELDLGRGQIIVRHGKGGKDRVVMLPRSCALILTNTWPGGGPCTIAMLLKAWRGWRCPMRSRGSIRRPRKNSGGNFCLPRGSVRVTRRPATSAGITSIPVRLRERWRSSDKTRDSCIASAVTLCAIASRRTWSSVGSI